MNEEILRISDSYYILTTSARIDDRTRVLKHDDTFALFDRFGDIANAGTGEFGIYGVYHHDTRFLSRFRLRLAGGRPLLLSSTIKDDNALLAVDLMNPDLRIGDWAIQRGTVHVFRARCLWAGSCHERLRVHNFGMSLVEVELTLEFESDYADIFEVRGVSRERRGRRLEPVAHETGFTLAYEGLDGRTRSTHFRFDPYPTRIEQSTVHYDLRLEPGADAGIRIAIDCEITATPGRARARSTTWYEQAAEAASSALARARESVPRIVTSNEQFNDWLNRSAADLDMMRTETAHGAYPYAGVPWFSTAFGRDGIITALQCLWLNPELARGVLQYLAATQAETDNAEQDSQPGKILHETRAGEMAATGEIPFGRYYGSVDSTPLFVLLAGAYYERTGDRELARVLWPHVERALEWMDRHGDCDGDGFVEYYRRSERGLVQQGWKDSQDSVFHADGELAEGPIALCEVQGYVYAAKRAASMLARALGLEHRVRALAQEARTLRRRFEERFWCPGLSTYALALDGAKRACSVRTSNAGHCLYAGIASQDRARRVAANLLDDASFSGWGIRTVAASERRYNPMSYHNGSVWPHDTALIAAGFARYGLHREAQRVLTGLFDASLFFEWHRLPELFCGFQRRPGESPTHYPVSCAPQAWAAGSVLLLLQSCLTLEVRGAERKLLFANPVLPESLQEVQIFGLRVNGATVDLALTRHRDDVGIHVLRREGNVRVIATK